MAELDELIPHIKELEEREKALRMIVTGGATAAGDLPSEWHAWPPPDHRMEVLWDGRTGPPLNSLDEKWVRSR